MPWSSWVRPSPPGASLRRDGKCLWWLGDGVLCRDGTDDRTPGVAVDPRSEFCQPDGRGRTRTLPHCRGPRGLRPCDKVMPVTSRAEPSAPLAKVHAERRDDRLLHASDHNSVSARITADASPCSLHPRRHQLDGGRTRLGIRRRISVQPLASRNACLPSTKLVIIGASRADRPW